MDLQTRIESRQTMPYHNYTSVLRHAYIISQSSVVFFLVSGVSELHALLQPYLLRRTKEAVLKDLPKKTEVILYHGISKLQKKLYKAILTKDLGNTHTPLIMVRLIDCGIQNYSSCEILCFRRLNFWFSQNMLLC